MRNTVLKVKNRLPLILGTFIVFLLTINVLLLFTLNNAFINLQLARTFPINNTPKNIQQQKPKPFSELVVVGDSRAQLWQFSEIISKKLNIINLGIGGYTSSQVLLSLQAEDKHITQQFVLLQMGINDFHWTKAIPKQQQQKIITNIKKNIKKLVHQLIENNNKVILTTIFPPQPTPLIRYLYWPNNGLNIINDLNAFIRNLTNNSNVMLLDSHKLLIDKSLKHLNSTFKDNDFFLHINPKGYQTLNVELDKILFKL